MHDFDARDETELNMIKGQTLRLAPKHLQPTGLRGWLLASSSASPSAVNTEMSTIESTYIMGLVPANRIKVIGRRLGASGERVQEKEKPDVIKSSNK